MTEKEKMIPVSEAAYEVELACRRIGMMHIAYARTLIKELGEERGKEVILAAIKEYGKLVGEQVKDKVLAQGLNNNIEHYGKGVARTLPQFGMNDKVERGEDGELKVYGCTMAKVWRELGEEDLGALYCYIDTAKYMYYNDSYKLTHTCAMPAHKTDYCAFEVQKTTEEEKKDFYSEKDWRYLDKNLTAGLVNNNKNK